MIARTLRWRPTCLGSTSAGVLLLAVCAAGKSIIEFGDDVRKSNIIRVSKQECADCLTMEELYKDNDWVFMLFYERALGTPNQYKTSIIAGFHATCAAMRWGRVACGVVDMVEDRDYALRYIAPEKAPGHILIRQGTAIPMPKDHVTMLMQRPGDQEIMLMHVRELTAPEFIDISEEANSRKLGDMLKRHEVVIAGFVGRDKVLSSAFRAAAQRLVLTGELPGDLPLAGAAEKPIKKSKKSGKQPKEQRQRVPFVSVSLTKKEAPTFSQGTVAVYVQPSADPETKSLSLTESSKFNATALELEFAAIMTELAKPHLTQRLQGTSQTAEDPQVTAHTDL